MPVLLNVPYIEKEEAKALGAKWDPKIKKWYAVKDYTKFVKWIGIKEDQFMVNVFSDYIYIVEGMIECYKCHKMTPVIGFSFYHSWDVDIDLDLSDEYIHEKSYTVVIGRFDPMPPELIALVQKSFNFKKYPRMMKDGYLWGNYCEHCKSLQRDIFVFEGTHCPFVEGNEQNLKIYPVKLKYDFVVDDFEPRNVCIVDGEKIRKVAPTIDISGTIVRI